jgi:hypothetical protein
VSGARNGVSPVHDGDLRKELHAAKPLTALCWSGLYGTPHRPQGSKVARARGNAVNVWRLSRDLLERMTP